MTVSPTTRILLGFLAVALVLCLHTGANQDNDRSSNASSPPARNIAAAVEQDLADHITVPFFSFAGLTAPRENPAL